MRRLLRADRVIFVFFCLKDSRYRVELVFMCWKMNRSDRKALKISQLLFTVEPSLPQTLCSFCVQFPLIFLPLKLSDRPWSPNQQSFFLSGPNPHGVSALIGSLLTYSKCPLWQTILIPLVSGLGVTFRLNSDASGERRDLFSSVHVKTTE